jgi:hypothetical protein
VRQIVTKRLEEIPHPNKWKGVVAGSKMRTAKGKRTFVILEITETHVELVSWSGARSQRAERQRPPDTWRPMTT